MNKVTKSYNVDAAVRRIAVVTGASSGIGEAFARRLASQGYNVILIARRAEILQKISSELEAAYDIHAEFIAADLSDPACIASVEQRLSQEKDIEFLVNSAGFAYLGRFTDIPIQQYVNMIQCHNLALVRLCHAVLPAMVAKRRGSIINISSIGAFTAKRGDAVYCATKAFTNLFSETLQIELKGTGVRVQALCPGFILTGFHDTPSYAPLHVKQRIPRFIWNTPDELVTNSLRALERNKVVYIPYFKNQLVVTLSKLGFIEQLTNLLASFFHQSEQRGAS